MTQRGNHCRLVWYWIRPRGKLRWKHVKRRWEGCPGVVSRNDDIAEIKETKISRWAFVLISVSVRWARVRPMGFCPYTRPNLFKGNNWFIFCLDKNPKFDCFGSGGFFSHTFSAIFVRACIIRLTTSVLLSLILSHTTVYDRDVIGHGNVRKVKFAQSLNFFDEVLFDNI